jgi:hypothetical protein
LVYRCSIESVGNPGDSIERMTPFILFLTVAAFITGMFWKLEPFSASPQTSPSHIQPPQPSPEIQTKTSPTTPTTNTSNITILYPKTIDDWDPLYILSLERPRLSTEQVAFLTSQTVLDMAILPDLRVEDPEDTEDFTMEDSFRYKGVLFHKNGFDFEEKKDDETQRVEALVSKVYESEEWEPVVQKTGNHTYSISELRQRGKNIPPSPQM